MNSGNGYHGPTFTKQTDSRQLLTPSDYEQKRMIGIRTMQNRPAGGYRVPTNTWVGYGISHTSPSLGSFHQADKMVSLFRQTLHFGI